MKVTLEFNLPEDQEEFDIHRQAMDFYVVLSDLDRELRAKLKYQNLTKAETKVFQEVRDRLTELCNLRNVEI
ncbi:hypothetical protein EBZ39_05690 [bacterium]|nr:hypothetical protein [bacterium]